MAWGNKTANKQAGQAQSQALAAAKRKMTHAHQWEVWDLNQAGLNPILSANASPNMASVAPVMGAVSSASDWANVGIQGAKAGMDASLLKQQRTLLKQQWYNQWMQGERANAERRNIDMDTYIKQASSPYVINSAKLQTERDRIYNRMMETGLPKRKSLEDFYTQPAGKGMLWWSEFFKNLVGPFNFSASASASAKTFKGL